MHGDLNRRAGWILAFAATVVAGGCPNATEQIEQLIDQGADALTANQVFQQLSADLASETAPVGNAELMALFAAPDDATFGESAALFETVAYEEIAPENDGDGEPLLAGVAIARGSLAGEFTNDQPGQSSFESPGVFRGRWFASSGAVEGLLRGEYRPLRGDDLPPGLTGAGAFQGRYVNDSGDLRGVLRGRYGRSESGEAFFFGRWHDRHDRVVGLLRGRWNDRPDTGGGRFEGHWAAFDVCRQVQALDGAEEPAGIDLEAELERLVAANPDVDAAFERDPIVLDANEPPVAEEIDPQLHGGPPCIDPGRPSGFLRGWHRPLPRDPNRPDVREGVIRARWHAANRRVGGRLVGHYVSVARTSDGAQVEDGSGASDEPLGGAEALYEPGVAEGEGDGDPIVEKLGVLHARYRSRNGVIRGHVRGEYGITSDGVGVFRGRYFTVDGERRGVIRGRWDDAPNRPGGPLFGTWSGVDFGEEDEGGDDSGDGEPGDEEGAIAEG